MSLLLTQSDIDPVLRSEVRMDHLPDSVSRCRELIAVAVSQIDGDPIVGDRLIDPALEITVAHFKKIIALQRADRRNPMTHENAEDLTANSLIGRSVKHRSTIGFARHRSYGRTATVDKIAQPMGNVGFGRTAASRMAAFEGRADTTFCTANVCFDPKRTLPRDSPAATPRAIQRQFWGEPIPCLYERIAVLVTLDG